MSSMTNVLRYPASLVIIGLIGVMVAAVLCPRQAGSSASGNSAQFPCTAGGGSPPPSCMPQQGNFTQVAMTNPPIACAPSGGGAPPCIQQAAATTTTTAANPGWLGVIIVDLRPGNMNGLALSPDVRGVLVDGVTAGSPAATIGIRPNDVIVGVNGHGVVDMRSFSSIIAGQSQGSMITIDVWRQGRLTRLSASRSTRSTPFSTAV